MENPPLVQQVVFAGNARQEIRVATGFLATPHVKRRGRMVALQRVLPQISAEKSKVPHKEKTRPGGQPDGSKPYGRLGWMGARAEYSCWGGITAPTPN